MTGIAAPVSARGAKRALKAKANTPIVDINPAPDHVARAFKHDATVTLDGTAKRSGVPRPHDHGRDPERQGIEAQIRQVKASLEKNMRQIAHYMTHNRPDQAASIISLAATKRNRILFLTAELARATLGPSMPEPDPVQRKSKTKLSPIKTRRFARWSDK